jgi:hypothetical protein
MYTILGVTGMWFGKDAFTQYMTKENNELQAQKEQELKKADSQTSQKQLEVLNNSIDALVKVSQNKNIQDSINKPKQATLELLKNDEVVQYNNSQTLTKEDAKKYDYIKPIVEDIEEEITEQHTIESYNFQKQGKLFKFVGVSTHANSEAHLSTKDRIKLISLANNGNTVNLKLKKITDGATKKIKSIYIMELVQD